jgi:hypothetical protein
MKLYVFYYSELGRASIQIWEGADCVWSQTLSYDGSYLSRALTFEYAVDVLDSFKEVVP